MEQIKRNQYPNPQFCREYVSLNGEWDFAICKDGPELENLYGDYPYKINVPFCPESESSGIGHTDFIKYCRYRRSFILDEFKIKSKRLIIHFGAVDYLSRLFVNGHYVGENIGGYVPFSFDITDFLKSGENTLYLLVTDEKTYAQPRGKQAYMQKPFGCFYTRTTGIWQNVWLEYVSENHILNVKFTPNITDCSVQIDAAVCGDGDLYAEIYYGGKKIAESTGKCSGGSISLNCSLTEKHLWSVGCGNLYDVLLHFGDDTVSSYFGLRETKFNGLGFELNGEPVFQRLVLDQGFYPKGIYTAQSEEELVFDIECAIKLGFNGARLHQKIFDPLYLYHCDRLGYMAWGEYPSWGVDFSTLDSCDVLLTEWRRVLERDYSHPCIVAWCPLNEVWGNWQNDGKTPLPEYIERVYSFTKDYDSTRPCIDVSGGFHTKDTDVFDFHCYEEVSVIKEVLGGLEEKDILEANLLYSKTEENPVRYSEGLPVMISECGGFTFTKEKLDTKVETVNDGAVMCEDGWGYGEGAVGEDNFISRYEELMKLIFACSKLSGFCYTQLYDVEQEQNGFLTYGRIHKLSEDGQSKIRDINLRKAKIERRF